jgi:hypothetical protein
MMVDNGNEMLLIDQNTGEIILEEHTTQHTNVRNPDKQADSGTNSEDRIQGTDHLDRLLINGQTAEQERKPTKWEPQKLNPRHREIMRRILEGASYTDIAASMGIHKQTVMLVVTSPMFQGELEKLEKDLDYNVIQRAEDLSNEALDKIKELMRNARTQQLQFNAACRMLDTGGYSKIEKKIVGIVSGEDVIRELNKRRREKVLGVDTSDSNVDRSNSNVDLQSNFEDKIPRD